MHQIYPITKQALRRRTQDYQQWVETFARNHRIPIQWPDPDMKKKGLRQEDYARPYLLAMERRKRFGVYFIFKTMEPGPQLSLLPAQVPYPRSSLSHHQAAVVALHPLLLLHSR